MTQRDSQSGFSLLEMLVGLAILSMLLVLLTRAVQGLHVAKVTLGVTGQDQLVEPARHHLRRVLTDMRSIRTAGASAPLIKATSQSLEFVTGYAPAGAVGGLHRVTLRLAANANPDSFDLVEDRTPLRSANPSQATITSTLLRGVSSLQFRYFGSPSPGTPYAWRETWASPSRLPDMVNIDVAFAIRDDRRWTPMVTAVPAALDR